MSDSESFVIEAQLIRWTGRTSSSGPTVTFALPDIDGSNPFDGLPCGPAKGQRLAISIALIDDDESQKPISKKQHSNTRQAAILCGDELFWRFLETIVHHEITSPELAAQAVREHCGVQSRREFDSDSVKSGNWIRMKADFDNWKNGRT